MVFLALLSLPMAKHRYFASLFLNNLMPMLHIGNRTVTFKSRPYYDYD